MVAHGTWTINHKNDANRSHRELTDLYKELDSSGDDRWARAMVEEWMSESFGKETDAAYPKRASGLTVGSNSLTNGHSPQVLLQ